MPCGLTDAPVARRSIDESPCTETGVQRSICEEAEASRMDGPCARKEAARCRLGVSSFAAIASARDRERRRSIDGGWPVACAGCWLW